MNSPQLPAYRPAAIVLAVFLSTLHTRTLDAAITLNGSDAFVPSGPQTGDLTVTGDLSVVKGIDFGTATANPALSAVQINYFGSGENAAKFDLTDPLGTLQWRDNLSATARDKMKLDGGNVLTLYKSDGTGTGILLNPNTGQIQLSGTRGGIYADGNPLFTIGYAGNLLFGTRSINMSNTTPSSSSTTGALTVAGGIGVGMDSWINGIKVGRGGGNIATNTAYGYGALQCNSTGSYNTATGYDALYGNTTGSSNTASGFYSLYANTTGSSNTAVGNYSLSRNISGTSNTAFGPYSLGCNSTGSSNVAIGSYAGFYQSNGAGLVTTNSSVYLGANARGFSNLDQNSIVIGSGAIGEGANTTVIGTSNTVKTHLFGTVSASGFTANKQPVLTSSFGFNSSLSGNAILAIGDYTRATQAGAIAIGMGASALGTMSIALGDFSICAETSAESIALTGGSTTKDFSLAAAYGMANGLVSMAFGAGSAEGTSSIALGGFDYPYANWPANHSIGDNSVTLGGVGNQALGFSSFASGFWTKAAACQSVALGSLNLGSGSSADTWVETDPLLELGNGNAPRSASEPEAGNRSNAITTLKNGQTTLTNKAWKANASTPLSDPDADSASGGEALVVEGHTRLKGKVIIEQAQGDISMGIYGP